MCTVAICFLLRSRSDTRPSPQTGDALPGHAYGYGVTPVSSALPWESREVRMERRLCRGSGRRGGHRLRHLRHLLGHCVDWCARTFEGHWGSVALSSPLSHGSVRLSPSYITPGSSLPVPQKNAREATSARRVLPGIVCVCRGRPAPQSRRQALQSGLLSSTGGTPRPASTDPPTVYHCSAR